MPVITPPIVTGTTVQGGGTPTSHPNIIGTSPTGASGSVTNTAFDYNVVIVLLDDVGLEKFNAYDAIVYPPPTAGGPNPEIRNQVVRIPNIRTHVQLRGVTFNRFWVCPTCGPTRACLTSGLYPHHSGHLANIPEAADPNNPAPGGQSFYLGQDPTNAATKADRSRQIHQLLPTMLRAGRPNNLYKAQKFGKSHQMPFNFPSYHSANEGWERFRGHQMNLGNHFVWDYVETVRDLTTGQTTTTLTPGLATYGPARELSDMTQFLTTVGTQPFLIWWAPSVGHAAYQSPPSTPGTVGTIGAASIGNWTTAFGGSYPAAGTSQSYNLTTDPVEIAKRVMTQKHCIESVDEVFGRLVAQIQLAPGRYEKTVFIVLCDNGTSGDTVEAPFDFLHAKRFIYAGGTWAPLFIGGPVCGQGPRTSDQIVNVTDLEATIRDICRVYPSANADIPLGGHPRDGVSILGHLRDPSVLIPRAHNFTMIGGPQPGDGWDPGTRRYVSTPDQLSVCTSDGIHTYLKQGSPNAEKLFLATDFRQSETVTAYMPGNLMVTQSTNPVVIEAFNRLKGVSTQILGS